MWRCFCGQKEVASNHAFPLEHACKNDEIHALLQTSSIATYCGGCKGSPTAISRVLPETQLRRGVRHLTCGPSMSKTGQVSSRGVRCVVCTIFSRNDLNWNGCRPIFSVPTSTHPRLCRKGHTWTNSTIWQSSADPTPCVLSREKLARCETFLYERCINFNLCAD